MRNHNSTNPAPFLVYAVDIDHGEEMDVYLPCKGPTPQEALSQAKAQLDQHGHTVAIYQNVTP